MENAEIITIPQQDYSVDTSSTKLQCDAEESEKVDSGMDDDSQHSNEQGNKEKNDDSDDEEDIGRKSFSRKKNFRILDDDDLEDDSSRSSHGTLDAIKEKERTSLKTADDVLDAITKDSDQSSDEGEQMGEKSGSDSSGDEEEKETISSALKKKRKKICIEDDDDSNDSSRSLEKKTDNGSRLEEKRTFNPDIFDAEEDESDKEEGENKRDSGDETASDSDKEEDDEGFDESSIDPKLLKKLKKGASKQQTSKEKRKSKREEVMSIHSETQRIVRESRVNLPYHQPEPKPLSAFLERASKKRESYRTVCHSRDIQKAKAMQDIFEKTKIHGQMQKESTESKVDHGKSGQGNSSHTTPEDHDEEMSEKVCDNLSDDDLPDLEFRCRQSLMTPKSSEKQSTSCESEPVTNTCNTEEMVQDLPAKEDSRATEEKSGSEDVDKHVVYDKKSPLEDEDGSNTKGRSQSTEMEKDDVEGTKETQIEENGEHKTDNMDRMQNAQTDDGEVQKVNSVQPSSVSSEIEGSRQKKSLLLAKLPELSAPPKLSGGPDSFIDFNEEGENNQRPKNPGVCMLMDRFMKHSQKKKKHHAKDVDISIIEKETTGDQEELKMKSFTYHPTEEEENSLSQLDAPGAKLMALKEKLQVSMKKKREEARKQRQDIYDFDNEEKGYSDGEEILDDKDEMSDKSDTDVEDDDFDEQFGDFEEDENEEEEEKEKNPFADDEAAESDDQINEENNEDDENDEDDFDLKLQLSDADDEDEDSNVEGIQSKRRLSSGKKKPKRLQISDDEEEDEEEDDKKEGNAASQSLSKPFADLHQERDMDDDMSTMPKSPLGPQKDSKVEEKTLPKASNLFKVPTNLENLEDDSIDFVPFSKHLTSAQYPARKKSSSLTMPIEDSQDLYGSTQNLVSMALDHTQDTQSQSLAFSLEESQSQMLDADGFLRTGSTAKKPNKALNFGSCNIQPTQDNMDELLGLCSGRFAGDQEGEKKAVSCKNLFGQSTDATQVTQGNMSELLGLCSGKFVESATQKESSQMVGKKRKTPMDDDEESNTSLGLASDDEEFKSTKNAFSDDEDDDRNKRRDEDDDKANSEDESIDDDDDEMNEDSRGSRHVEKMKFKGFTEGNKHGRIRKDFVDAEAELSGSEYESDENLDLPEEEDILEMEEGDKDAVGTEEELRNQVGRAHLKQMIDEDKRKLLRIQEMYLPDGDLHSEGGGRVRRFRWSNIDDESQQDMFDKDSDTENQEEEEQDINWRKDRYEREKFLQEQKENQNVDTEDSQFLKLGKVFLKRRDSDPGFVKKQNTTLTLPGPKVTTKPKEAPGTPSSLLKLTNSRRGSFLSRDKETLAKIAEKTKGTVNPTGVKNSRNFVFQVLSPDKDTNSESMPAPTETKVRKAHKPKVQQPAAKKPRLDKDSSFSQNSVFQHL